MTTSEIFVDRETSKSVFFVANVNIMMDKRSTSNGSSQEHKLSFRHMVYIETVYTSLKDLKFTCWLSTEIRTSVLKFPAWNSWSKAFYEI